MSWRHPHVHVFPGILVLLAVTATSFGRSVPLAAQAASVGQSGLEVTEATIRELQAAMSSGRATSVEITSAYLARIEAYDQSGPQLNAMLRLNPRALAEAEAMDRERAERGPRGPLHGIPIVLKDNYDTSDMPTSAGTLALAGLVPPSDAFQVRKLREAGAVILGKTNMHELASGITTVGSLGGQTRNPYDPGRNPGGSSGGTGAAVAASFAAVGWGSDTCGSIRIPSGHNNLVGLRPTKGVSSIAGIIPLSHTQDVGGPLARSVEDLALALDATVGADPADPATDVLADRTVPDFAAALDESALAGARIGLFEPLFGDDPEDAAVAEVVRAAARRMEELGASVVVVDMPDFPDLLSGSGVIGHEFKWDLMDYLGGIPDPPVRSLTEIIESGLVHDAIIGLMRSWNSPTERDSEEYRAALAKRGVLREAILARMEQSNVDALVYPIIRRVPVRVGQSQPGSNCQLSAHTGLPALALPAGWVDELPVGMELLGGPFDDARLVAMGYAFEQAEKLRRAPSLLPPLGADEPPPPLSVEVRVRSGGTVLSARFRYDRPAGPLTYELELVGPSEEIHAVVLTHSDEQGRRSVAAHLSGPGALSAEGSLRLDDDLREELEGGRLYLELVTRGDPLAVARAPLIPASR